MSQMKTVVPECHIYKLFSKNITRIVFFLPSWGQSSVLKSLPSHVFGSIPSIAIFIIITIACINIILVCRQNLALSYSVLTVAIRNPLYVKCVCAGVCARPHTYTHT